MSPPIALNTLVMTEPNWGTDATAATATIPAARAYSTKSCPCVLRQKLRIDGFTFQPSPWGHPRNLPNLSYFSGGSEDIGVMAE
jgi:hypothetical protein